MPIDLQNLPGSGANGDHRVYSNYFADESIIQQVCIVQPKNIIMDVLRRRFSRDNIYTYKMDEYGFPAVKDMTGQDIDDFDTTKIMISDVFRFDAKFYPLITVKTTGGSHTDISFNQEATIKYRTDLIENTIFERKIVRTPTHRVYAGLWDMGFEITIYSKSLSELEELIEIVSMMFVYSSRNELRANGLAIKSTDIGSISADDESAGKLFSSAISIRTQSEWRVEIPIENLIEKILFYFDVKRTPAPPNANISDVLTEQFDNVLEMAKIEL
jgi:hypothetical protein